MKLNEGQYIPNALEKKIAQLEAENEALRELLQQTDGVVCDYVMKGNYDDNTEPFYTLHNSVEALLADTKE